MNKTLPIFPLWSEYKRFTELELIGEMLREEFGKERIVREDMSYLAKPIENWWKEQGKTNKSANISLKESLKTEIFSHLKDEHLFLLKNVGHHKSRVAAVFFERTFNTPDRTLALLVHESFADIAGIIDLKYFYEDHKELYPKDSENITNEWGKGLGVIRPHSDDIYEFRDINVMSLTVCKDISATPTWFWLLKDVVACLTNKELGQLALANGHFLSGKNVEGKTIESIKPILRKHNTEGVTFRLDFRIDDFVGPRMRFEDPELENICTKMRLGLEQIEPISSLPLTGSIGILANFKILHGRGALNAQMLYEGEESRILFRSKGIK